jgi:ketosteroid isomerase-like protein
MEQEGSARDALELTRRAYTALARREFEAVAAMFEPAGVWDMSRWGLGSHGGERAILRFMHDWFGALEHYELPAEEAVATSPDTVLVIFRLIGRDRGAIERVNMLSAFVFRWRDGRIARVTAYPDLAEARARAAQVQGSAAHRNIAVHSRIVAAIRSGTVPDGLLAEGFQVENRASAVTDYTYHGPTGLREWASDVFENFAAGARYGVEEIVAAGADYVAAAFSIVGRGAMSGEPLEFRWWGVTWFADGRATSSIGYARREEALAAVAHGEQPR